MTFKHFYSYLHSFYFFILNTLQLQIFLMLICLPILIWWGLPISAVSIISTPLFSPLFTLFLLLSTIIFFTQLLTIPNSWLIWALEYVTHLWLNMLSLSWGNTLFYVSRPPLLLLLPIPLVTLYIMQTTKIKSILQRVSTLLLFGFLYMMLLSYYDRQQSGVIPITLLPKPFYLIFNAQHTILVDPGVLSSKPPSSSWITYNLATELIKHTGRAQIDTLVFLQFNQRILLYIHQMLQELKIGTIYLPYYSGKLNYGAWKAYKEVNELAREKKVILKRILPNSSKVINISPHMHFHISATSSIIEYQAVTYPLLRIEGSVEKSYFCINAQKSGADDRI